MRPLPESTFVLAVAISEYQAEALKPIPACKTDIRLIEDWFREEVGLPERNVRVLTDANATVDNIRAGFEDHLVANAWQQRQRGNAEHARFIFYFAGHSSTFRVRDVITGPQFVVDSLPAFDSRVGGETDIFRTTLAGWFRELTAITANVEIILDCCQTDWPELACAVLLANGAPVSDLPVDAPAQPGEIAEDAKAGALTLALMRALRLARRSPVPTWSSVYERMVEVIQASHPAQMLVLRGSSPDQELASWVRVGVSQ